MHNWQIVVLTLYGAVVFVALARHFLFSAAFRGVTFLKPAGVCDGGSAPLVSILVPAKDEEEVIERCIRSVLAQSYPNFELLVVDDRSADRTADIVEKMTASEARLRLVRIHDLPEGWTGKTHALDVGQRQAKGNWLLFVDADTTLNSGCLTAALNEANAHRSDLLSLLPSLEMRSFWEKVVQPFASACLMVLFPVARVNDPKQPEYAFANGQFILIRRSAYDAIGGHEAVRDKFVEDIHLGRLVRRKGLNLRLVMGGDVVAVRMYSTFPAIIRGWSRILYSAVDHRPGKLYLLAALILVFTLSAYVVLLGAGALLLAGYWCPFLASLFALGVLHELIQTTIFARIYSITGTPQRYLVLRFLAAGVMLGVLARTIRMCRTHRVVWRGTVYGKEIQRPIVNAPA